MAGKYDLQEVGSILLDMTSENWEGVPEGSARLRFNAEQGSLQLEYLNPSFMSVNTTLASGESAVLAQNFLSSQPLVNVNTVDGPPIGVIYLPSGNLDPSSSAYLMVKGDVQLQGPATLRISIFNTPRLPNQPPPNPLANFEIVWIYDPQDPTMDIAYGNCPMSPAFPVPISQGWHFVAVTLLDGSLAPEGFFGGIRLVVVPTP